MEDIKEQLDRIEEELKFLSDMMNKKFSKRKRTELHNIQQEKLDKFSNTVMKFIEKSGRIGIMHGLLLKRMNYHCQASIVNSILRRKIEEGLVRVEKDSKTRTYFSNTMRGEKREERVIEEGKDIRSLLAGFKRDEGIE